MSQNHLPLHLKNQNNYFVSGGGSVFGEPNLDQFGKFEECYSGQFHQRYSRAFFVKSAFFASKCHTKAVQAKILYEKRACKMLMKLTPDWSFLVV